MPFCCVYISSRIRVTSDPHRYALILSVPRREQYNYNIHFWKINNELIIRIGEKRGEEGHVTSTKLNTPDIEKSLKFFQLPQINFEK